MTEKELQNAITTYLSKYFYAEEEVWSTDRSGRIDIVLVHKSDIARSYPIGIEVKVDGKKTGSSLGKWLDQAMRYNSLNFTGYGNLLICTYPQVSAKCLEEGELMTKHNCRIGDTTGHHHNVNTFIGHFKIGELQKYSRDFGMHKGKEFCRIVFNSRLIWDERFDQFRTHNYEFVCKR